MLNNIFGNSWKHFLIAFFVYTEFGWLHNLLIDGDPNSLGTLWIFSLIIFIMVAVKLEFNQRRMYIDSLPEADRFYAERDYWKHNGRHSLMDIGMGILGAVLGLMPFWTR